MGKNNVKIYAYKCNMCFGGEVRCASGERYRCHCDGYGSRYCYEPKMILELDVGDIKKNNKNNKIIFNGKYNGYGDMILNINKNDLDDYKNKPDPYYIKNKNITWEHFDLRPRIEKNYYNNKNNSKEKKIMIKVAYESGRYLFKKGVNIYCNSCYNQL